MTVSQDSTPRRSHGLAPGESLAWSVMSTLAAGPLLYGLIGWGIDTLTGTARLFTALGIVVGFVLSFSIIYVRYGRETPEPRDQGARSEHPDADGSRP